MRVRRVGKLLTVPPLTLPTNRSTLEDMKTLTVYVVVDEKGELRKNAYGHPFVCRKRKDLEFIWLFDADRIQKASLTLQRSKKK